MPTRVTLAAQMWKAATQSAIGDSYICAANSPDMLPDSRIQRRPKLHSKQTSQCPLHTSAPSMEFTFSLSKLSAITVGTCSSPWHVVAGQTCK